MSVPPTKNPVFNPSDFVTASSGGDLTEAQANLKYLRLASESTCSALETFSLGIKTASILSLDPTQEVNILPNQSTGDVNLAPSMTGMLILGSGVNSVRAANVLLTDNLIDNATNPASGVLNYSSQSTTGIVHIADAATSTGSLYVGSVGRPLTLKGSSASDIDFSTAPVKCGTITSAGLAATSLAASTTLGVSGTSTLAVVNASGLVSANGGLAATSLDASTTLGVSGTSTLAVVNASGLVSANGGLSATSLAASTTLGVSGTSTLGVVSASGLLTASAGIKTDSIDASTANGTLVLGGTNCGVIRFDDNVQSITTTGAISAAGFTSSAAITNNSALNSPFTGGISAANFSSTLFDTASAALLKIGGTYANTINIGDALSGVSGTVNMHIANGINYLGNIEIGCGNSFRAGGTSINTKGSGGVVIGNASCASIALNSVAKVGMTGGLSTTAITASGLTTTAGLSLSGANNITLGTVAVNTTVLNATYSNSTPTLAMTLLGQTAFIYKTANSASIWDQSNVSFLSSTISNTGIYTISFQARYSGTGTAIGVQSWIYVSSPALYGVGGLGQLALDLVAYASPYLNMANGISMSGSWTGLVNAGASVQLLGFIQYSTTPYSGLLLGGAGSNYLSITRIA